MSTRGASQYPADARGLSIPARRDIFATFDNGNHRFADTPHTPTEPAATITHAIAVQAAGQS
jgi:hypothetical protein